MPNLDIVNNPATHIILVNGGPFAPRRIPRICPPPDTTNTAREFFGIGGNGNQQNQRRRLNDGTAIVTNGSALQFRERIGDGAGANQVNNGNQNHRQNPTHTNRSLIDEIDNGNTIMNCNMGRLETLLAPNPRRAMNGTAQLLANIGTFMTSGTSRKGGTSK